VNTTEKDLSVKQLLVMGGALFSMHFGASCMLYPVQWGRDSGTSVFITYIAIVLTALLLPLLAYVALARGKGSFLGITERICPKFGKVFCTITVLVMGPLYVVPRMSAAAWDAIAQLLGLTDVGILPVIAFNILFYAISYWFLSGRADTMDKIGNILFPVLIGIVVFVIAKGLITPISTHWQPKNYDESPVAYGLLQGYQTGDLPAALMFGLVILQGIHKAGISENRVNKNLIRVGLVGMGMLAITHLGHMVIGASTGGTIDLTLSALYGQVVLQLWGNVGAILFNVALIFAALTTAVGLGGSAGEFFSESLKGKASYKIICLVTMGVSALVSSLGLSNIVKFVGPLLDACYPTAIVVVLFYVLAPNGDNPRLQLGARFAMIGAAVTGCIGIFNTYLSLLNISWPGFTAFYNALPLSNIQLTWIPVSAICFIIGILVSRPKTGRKKPAKKQVVRIVSIFLALCLLGALCVIAVNTYVVQSTKKQILSPDDAAALNDVDCILVLGCYVNENGEPSAMLSDRLQRGVELYEADAAPKLLMSGDHGRYTYDEVTAMRQYALAADIPSQDVFMDHAGFSTYESIYRARDIFQAKKIIIVSQKYHLHRALQIANALGVEAYGVAADYRGYSGQFYRDVREILARNKDFVKSIFKPKPTFLGDAIPIFGDGNLTLG